MLDIDGVKQRLQNNLTKNDKYVKQISSNKKLKKAAVLIALFTHQNDYYVIMTKRSENLSSHKGQLCFPGGKEDFPGEASHVTATREAEEEIGLSSDHVTFIGSLLPVISFHRVAVTPIVALIKNLKDIKLNVNSAEVSKIFACPLTTFLDASIEVGQTSFFTQLQEEIRIHDFRFKFEKKKRSDKMSDFERNLLVDPDEEVHRIWGLTAKMGISAAVMVMNRQVTFKDQVTYDVERPQGKKLVTVPTWLSNL